MLYRCCTSTTVITIWNKGCILLYKLLRKSVNKSSTMTLKGHSYCTYWKHQPPNIKTKLSQVGYSLKLTKTPSISPNILTGTPNATWFCWHWDFFRPFGRKFLQRHNQHRKNEVRQLPLVLEKQIWANRSIPLQHSSFSMPIRIMEIVPRCSKSTSDPLVYWAKPSCHFTLHNL